MFFLTKMCIFNNWKYNINLKNELLMLLRILNILNLIFLNKNIYVLQLEVLVLRDV